MKPLITALACLLISASSSYALASDAAASNEQQNDESVNSQEEASEHTQTDSRHTRNNLPEREEDSDEDREEDSDEDREEDSDDEKRRERKYSSDESPTIVSADNNTAVLAGKIVALSGQKKGGGKRRFKWQQVSGPSVEISNSNKKDAIFTAPHVTSTQTLVFSFSTYYEKKDKKHQNFTDFISVQINPAVDGTVVRDWNLQALALVRRSERGPTISGRFAAYMNTALYSAWAAFDKRADGWLVDLDLDDDYPDENTRTTLQEYAMAATAYDVFYEFAAGDTTMLRQTYLEINAGEDAEIFRAQLIDQANTLLNSAAERAANRLVDDNAAELLDGVRVQSSDLASQLLTFSLTDGAQVTNDYVDAPVMFEPTAWALPRPERAQRNNINFYNQNEYTDANGVLYPKYEFPEFDPVAAAQVIGATWDATGALIVASPANLVVNPAVIDGTIKITSDWQSLTEWGIFPSANDGGNQVPLTSHWGNVVPFALPSGDYLRPSSVLTPYDANGALNAQFVAESIQITQFAKKMQDGAEGGAIQRARSEYWELGDSTPYPPGWWLEISLDLIERADIDLKTALKITMSLSQAVFDAGIASWDTKYHFDSARPFTVINQLFFGSLVPSFKGDTLAGTDDRDVWFPYQLRRNFTPPFPDIPSGHSAFSYAASTVLKEVFDSNHFGYQSTSFNSRFDTTDGFDGDASNGNEFTDLSWTYLSLAAEEAGMSRLYGGIHMQEGNWIGLKFGIQVGHAALAKVNALMEGDADSTPDTSNTWLKKSPTFLFGTMSSDTLSAINQTRRKVEIYGFYGDDRLDSDASSRVASVELFGGYGQDAFLLNGKARLQIRDYEAGETITIGRGPWDTDSREALSVEFLAGEKTLLKLGDEAVVTLDGHWRLDQLNINVW